MKLLLFLFFTAAFFIAIFSDSTIANQQKNSASIEFIKNEIEMFIKTPKSNNILKIWINFLTWRSSFMRRRFWLLFLSFNRFFNRFFSIFLFVRHLDQRDFQCFRFEFWKSASFCRFWRIRIVWRSPRFEIFDERF